jgi:capsular exopolysaccharide synthesis family protein
MAWFQSEIPAQKETRSEGISGCLVTVLDPASVASEAFRTLRTNLLYAPADTSPKVIVVTSPGSAEGKSTVCANLGVVLAQAGKNTLIIDCDFRRPAMHKIFGLRNTYGIVDVLLGQHSLQEVYQEALPGVGLKLLATGPLTHTPTELLGSQHLSELFASVRKQFDYVLVDSSPTGLVSDPTILAAQGDAILLTLDAQRTRKREVQKAMRSLTAVGINVLGTVMNNVKGIKDGYY